MRNQWRLLLLLRRSSVQTSRPKPFHQVRNPFLSSSFHTRNHHQVPIFPNLENPRFRSFSTEPVLQDKDPNHVLLTNIFSKSSSSEEILKEIESNDVKISHDLVLEVLSLEENVEISWKFFNWVLKMENGKLSSKSYNLMLVILGRKGYLKEFWGLVEVMKKKGYSVSKRTFFMVEKKFEEGLESDLDKLMEVFDSKEGAIKGLCSKVCRVLRENDWSDEVQKSLSDMNVVWSSDLVAMVVEKFSLEPMKALMFFWWVEETPSFSHDKVSYNAMVKVLGREDCLEKFWRVVDEMKNAGFEMDMETYITVIGRFYKRKMIKDAVDLYELMMGGESKPGFGDSLFLMRKILVGKELDIDLFSRVMKIFTGSGNTVTASIFEGYLKALTSVCRLQECRKVLKVMEESGFLPTSAVYDTLIICLCSANRPGEALQILDEMVNVKQFRPRHTTFKDLLEKLLVQRKMKEAMNVLGLMKNQGFPPFLDPFIKHISKHGTGDDAMSFIKGMTVRNFPSTPVFVRMLEAFLNVGRHDEAHEWLSKCPNYIRNHADVLNLLYAIKPKAVNVAVSA